MLQKINQVIKKAHLNPVNQYLETLKNDNQDCRDIYPRLFYYLVKEFKPNVALEIGVYRGISSLYMAEAMQEGMVVGIDILWDQLITQLERHKNFIFLGISSLESEFLLNSIVEKYGKIGLVYQDSSHHYLESKREWEIISPLCKENAIWICDDITPAFYNTSVDPPGKGMIQYFEEIPKRHKQLYDNLHYGSTQGIVII